MDLSDDQIAEAWLGTVGVSAFLDGGTVSITPTAERKVQRYGGEITRRLTRFFERTRVAAPALPDIDMRKVSDALTNTQPEDDLVEKLSGFPGPAAMAVSQAAQRAISYLRAELPDVLTNGITTEYKDPSPRAAARFAQCYSVADDPLFALDLLVAGQVATKHVQALQACYPALYAGMQAEVIPAIADVFAGDTDSVTLPPRREKQLWVFTQGKQRNMTMTEIVQGLGEELQQPPSRPRPRHANSTKIYASASEQVAQD